MFSENTNDLMRLILEPTPISHHMLMAAWDSLCFESQCIVLLNYDKKNSRGLNHQRSEFLDIALKSIFPLVRYLASKLCFEKHYKEQIAKDDHPLVSASNMTSGCMYFVPFLTVFLIF